MEISTKFRIFVIGKTLKMMHLNIEINSNITLRKEEWRDIPRYLGYYQVSTYGRVRAYPKEVSYMNPDGTFSCEVIGGGIIKPTFRNNGYASVGLVKNNMWERQESVHRLVAEAFIPNPYNLPIVNHKDENPSNNHIGNLEWCTHAYNVNYGTATERRSKTRRLHGSKIGMYSLDDDSLIRVFGSVAEISEHFGKDVHGNVLAVCNGRRKKSLGYKWRFMDE